eukprot:jgi/Undpi1/2301/HiC_scaffold_13.g05685.m1
MPASLPFVHPGRQGRAHSKQGCRSPKQPMMPTACASGPSLVVSLTINRSCRRKRFLQARKAVVGKVRPSTWGAMALVICFLSRSGCEAIYATHHGETNDEATDLPAHCTMFHHMVKSGGTSIRSKLSDASAVAGGPDPGLCVIGPETHEPCIDALHHSSVIVGYVELLRHPMEAVGRHCHYFTMMRHPIDRLVSAFFYCPDVGDKQARPEKWCGTSDHPDPITNRLVEFAREDWMCKAIYQLNFSSYCPPGAFCQQTMHGKPPTSLDALGGWSALAYAQNLLLDYEAVGIFEEWDVSMRLFNAKVHSPVHNWVSDHSENQGPKSAKRDALLRWAHSSTGIRAAVAGDLLLYDLAVSIFHRQTSEALGIVWNNRKAVE